MTAQAAQKLDMTMMFGFHAAFRRDLDRLAKASETPGASSASVQAGWLVFKTELDRHHHAEDDDLWPVAREGLASDPEGLAVLDAMEAEHSVIDPLIANVDAALEDPNSTAESKTKAVAEFRDALTKHLDHEEKDAIPLLDRSVTPEQWKEFSNKQRKKHGMGHAKVLFPWMLDGDIPEGRAVLGLLPPPLRLINNWFWVPAYKKTPRW